jgi:hypothetical protein
MKMVKDQLEFLVVIMFFHCFVDIRWSRWSGGIPTEVGDPTTTALRGWSLFSPLPAAFDSPSMKLIALILHGKGLGPS